MFYTNSNHAIHWNLTEVLLKCCDQYHHSSSCDRLKEVPTSTEDSELRRWRDSAIHEETACRAETSGARKAKTASFTLQTSCTTGHQPVSCHQDFPTAEITRCIVSFAVWFCVFDKCLQVRNFSLFKSRVIVCVGDNTSTWLFMVLSSWKYNKVK